MNNSGWLLAGAAAMAGLAMSPAALAAEVQLVATLSGAGQTGGGDADGSGSFSAKVDPEAGDLCYTLAARNISTPTAAHIHAGGAGTDGAPVVTLEVTGEDLDECLAVEPDKLKAILAAPGDHYVNIHTADFPKGAVRGQLSKK